MFIRLSRLFCCFLCVAATSLHAQKPAKDCSCTTKQVMDNTVTPSTGTIGEVITVSSAAEFRGAINRANNEGGNLTILVENGTYRVATTSWYPYLRASNVIIRSATGQRDSVILTGTGMRDVSPGTEAGIFAVGDSITIANLTIRDVGNHGIMTSGDGTIVYNVRIQDTYEQLLKGVASNEGTDDARVTCNLFEYTAGVGPQWYIGGIDAHQADRWTISDNVFRGIASPSRSHAEHAIHLWQNSNDNLIERNVIVNCDRGIGLGLGNRDASLICSGVIRNNMIFNDGKGIFNDVGVGLESAPNSEVYHNTIHIEYQNAIEYRWGITDNVVIANNLVNQRIRSRNGGSARVENNITDASAGLYRAPAIGDLRLVEGDHPNIIDAALTQVPGTEVDMDHTPRPQGSAMDIGAFERIVTTGSNEKNSSLKQLEIYPNPVSELLSVPGYDGKRFIVYGGDARKVMEGTLINGRLDVSGLPAGQFVLIVGGEYGARFVVAR